MIRLRALLLVVLAALMTVTGIGAASARGSMAADGIICGTGTFNIVLAADGLPLFDSGGDPVEARDVPCLDCTLGGLALAPETPAPQAVALCETRLHHTPHIASAAELWRLGGMGRSPPVAA
ncbi:hypothetical protein N8I71_10000 [Roseibacterium sp. SDUM158016]|uniref:hypothetical protein n=1 Tax=Roseicyclus sediminis TaxID=2980997 RepID=UPI0021CE5731|nr:hypothetical protein [Roseibacterium sp. SDUM158016]MCU4653165.1 hypothetical protein [Roseibacterium sp. SDUM158016]